MMTAAPEVSVVIPVLRPYDGLADLNAAYMRTLAGLRESYEVIYVLDAQDPATAATVARFVETQPGTKSITLNRSFNDSTALSVGMRVAAGERVLVLPAYPQVEPDDVLHVLDALSGADLAIGERDRSSEPFLNRMHGRVFNGLIAFLAACPVRDMGCELLAFRREVAADVSIHGGQHRFLPLLADRVGFSVRGVPVRQARENRHRAIRTPAEYARSLLDVMTVVFLSRFVKKPLRFFGVMGLLLVLLGAAIVGWVVAQRLIYGVPLATRPIFVLGTLVLVAGLQIMGIGLIGEIIIFSRAGDLPAYHIKEIVAGEPRESVRPMESANGTS
jgi:glycosyltransferase involved in cell wall biosynthesis